MRAGKIQQFQPAADDRRFQAGHGYSLVEASTILRGVSLACVDNLLPGFGDRRHGTGALGRDRFVLAAISVDENRDLAEAASQQALRAAAAFAAVSVTRTAWGAISAMRSISAPAASPASTTTRS